MLYQIIHLDIMSKELSYLEEVAEDIFRVKLSTDLIQCTVSGFTLFGWCQTIGKPVKMVVSSDLLLFDCSKVFLHSWPWTVNLLTLAFNPK